MIVSSVLAEPDHDHDPPSPLDPLAPLIVSPYTSPTHLLDPLSVSASAFLMARALAHLKPVCKDYATAPYHYAFNWKDVFEELQVLSKAAAVSHWQGHFYIVVFRSRLRPKCDLPHLHSLDEQSHAEAMKSGGLLKYWFGKPDENGRNLATCTCSITPQQT